MIKPKPAVISRAEMARRLGVSPPAVTQACRQGQRLYEARSGRGIDVTHDAAVRWLAVRSAASKKLEPQLADPIPPVEEAEPVEAEQSVDELQHDLGPWRAQIDLASLVEPLGILTEKYGEAREFGHWVQQRKNLAAAMKEEMLQARVAGRLIARTTVERMLEKIDVAFRLLLSDAPRTIATRIDPNNMVATSAIVREQIEQILQASRAQMIESLNADDPLAPLVEASAAE
jgi:DNA-binding transcriptional regulator YdaS (Cro superfamily)